MRILAKPIFTFHFQPDLKVGATGTMQNCIDPFQMMHSRQYSMFDPPQFIQYHSYTIWCS